MGHRNLDGKLAVVTGGSNGIGAACVRAFAEAGARVVVGYHHGIERAEALRASLPGSGHRVAAIALEDEASHTRLAEALGTDPGRVDILVNSAGYTRKVAHDDLNTMTPALFNEILLANAGGPFSVTRALLPLLQASGDGLVVNVSSVSAFTGGGSNIAYCAAKAALDTLALSMARVFGPQVRFMTVSPAGVDTGFVEGRTREDLQKRAVRTPLGRIVTPEDVADSVLACATHLRASTGARIVVDGGHVL